MNKIVNKIIKFKFCIRFSFAALWFLSTSILAQDYIIKQIRIEDGLSQSTIFSSLQDREGYMWFATRSGLNRYDGYKFNLYFNHPKDSTSLSDDGTNSLYEDRNGNLWVGTIYGNINRFNRTNETFVYKNASDFLDVLPDQTDDFYEYPLSFSRNQKTTITSIAEDTEGKLWIGTWGCGIIVIDKYFKKYRHFYFDVNNPTGLKTNRIMDLLFDVDGKLWVATFGGGLTRITKSFANSKEQFSFDTLLQGNDIFSLSDNKLLNLFQDSNMNIWIGSYYGGLILIQNDQTKLPFGKAKIDCQQCPISTANYSSNTIMSFAEDKEHYLWIGTFGGGLIRYDKNKNESLHFFNDPMNQYSLGDNDVLSLCTDRSGIVWAGSHLGAGITKIYKNNARFNRVKHEPGKSNTLNDDVVWSIYKDDENILWIGTYKGGINKYDPASNTFSYLKKSDVRNSLSSNHIRAIKEDSFGNLWIGTYDGGLNILNKKTNKVNVFKNDPLNPLSIGGNQVQDILIESDSVYWIATFGGGLNKAIIKGNPIDQKLKFKKFINQKGNPQSISDNRIYKLFRSRDGVFWICSYGGGLNSFDPKTEIFKRYPKNTGLEDNFNIENLMAIHEDEEGILWLGSYGGSLTSLDRSTGKFKRYSFSEGITSGVVYGILEDDAKNLWISSDNGIFKLNLTSKEIKRYDIQDGLQSLEFSGGAYLKDKSDIMYFGGISGYNYFDPHKIKSNNYIPPVVITSVKVFNEHIKGERKELVLDYKKNFISFEFASLDYSDPLDNQYSFMLEGLQNEWQVTEASSRTATYTNLSPGTYVFKVRGSNSDGVWGNNYASIKIIILHPFWQSWWFIVISVILMASFLYYLSTIRIKNLLAIEKLKSKLAADLHDNIGSGLTEISILSEVASRKNNFGEMNSNTELKNISDISRKLVDSMSDIVWVVNPSRDSLHDLIIRLKDTYSELLNSLQISFKTRNLEKLTDVKLPMEVKQNLYLIFKEAINNAIKHSKCKHITLETNLRNDVLEIVLNDDGIGFDESLLSKGNGLKNMENRAAQINGRIKIKSSVNHGTTIRFIGKSGLTNKLKVLFKQ
jgi:ligand-binding sensor domain-containing protein/two-component sensor histidine kinase